MKTNAVVLLLTGLLLTNLPAAAVSIEGVVIPGTLALPGSDQELVLNGAGIRKKFFMDIYIGALYLPARTSDATAILSDAGAASVTMHFLYKEVDRDKITDGWNDGLGENVSREEFRTLAKRLEKFNALFRTVRRGDVIRIDYNPVTG